MLDDTNEIAAPETPAADVEATDGLMHASIALIELGAAAGELLACLNLAVDLSIAPSSADRDCDIYMQLVDAWTKATLIKQQATDAQEQTAVRFSEAAARVAMSRREKTAQIH